MQNLYGKQQPFFVFCKLCCRAPRLPKSRRAQRVYQGAQAPPAKRPKQTTPLPCFISLLTFNNTLAHAPRGYPIRCRAQHVYQGAQAPLAKRQKQTTSLPCFIPLLTLNITFPRAPRLPNKVSCAARLPRRASAPSEAAKNAPALHSFPWLTFNISCPRASRLPNKVSCAARLPRRASTPSEAAKTKHNPALFHSPAYPQYHFPARLAVCK